MTGRPTGLDSQRRKARFLALIAEGIDPVKARKDAGMDADRALRIVTDPGFCETIRQLREAA